MLGKIDILMYENLHQYTISAKLKVRFGRVILEKYAFVFCTFYPIPN